jgi:hypothetical protein
MSLGAIECSRSNHPSTRKEEKMRVRWCGTGMKETVAALGLLAVVATAGLAFGQPPGGGPPPGPPPEAIQACQGRTVGATVQFQTPRGDTITGTCREMHGQLVAMPEGGPGRGPQGPPAEAIAACEGKSQGETVQFQTPRGDTITGTCRDIQGHLVAVPQR